MTIESEIHDANLIVKKRWWRGRAKGNRKMTSVLAWWLDAAFRRLIDKRVAERTEQLRHEMARIEAALRAAKMHVFFQDRDLRYKTVVSAQGEEVGAELLGRTDEQVLPSTERDAVIAAKRRVIATATPEDCEVSYVTPEGRTLYALHIEPSFGPDRQVEGVTCSAIDITRLRTLESEQRRLSDEVKTTLQRYELALRESKVTVFTQDRSLRYTSISNPIAGLAVDNIIGGTDEGILDGESLDAAAALKRAVLDTGTAKETDVSIRFHAGDVRWYDLHVEPLRDVTGAVTGLIGAAIDVTTRKEDEAHLRLLMRELTHRSKNLLAVIQAMARQTARHADSTEQFLEQFDARLQALATSHDVLIEEGWHGASLRELVGLQLERLLDSATDQIAIEGPTVLLRPEAAQALGFAFHELAVNAKKFGALSVPGGRVKISWNRRPEPQGDSVDLRWEESNGPAVSAPIHRRFGSVIIERHLAHAIDGEVQLSFAKEGVVCAIQIPPAQLVGFTERAAVKSTAVKSTAVKSTAGKSTAGKSTADKPISGPAG
jgi:PAS domain S-box-containing protein